jgi:large subunit ribosomal protein L17
MLSNMASSLIIHKRINTTVAKAKPLRMYVEPILTKAKEDTTHSRRIVFSMLQDKEAVTELFREISAKVADRPGGYTRIIKLGPRLGDNAEMAMIELVDYNENLLGDAASKKAKTTRRRRSTKKKADDTPVAAKEKPVKAAKQEVEEPADEEIQKTEVAEESDVKAEGKVEDLPQDKVE